MYIRRCMSEFMSVWVCVYIHKCLCPPHLPPVCIHICTYWGSGDHEYSVLYLLVVRAFVNCATVIQFGSTSVRSYA